MLAVVASVHARLGPSAISVMGGGVAGMLDYLDVCNTRRVPLRSVHFRTRRMSSTSWSEGERRRGEIRCASLSLSSADSAVLSHSSVDSAVTEVRNIGQCDTPPTAKQHSNIEIKAKDK